jgi:hypothetical protein
MMLLPSPSNRGKSLLEAIFGDERSGEVKLLCDFARRCSMPLLRLTALQSTFPCLKTSLSHAYPLGLHVYPLDQLQAFCTCDTGESFIRDKQLHLDTMSLTLFHIALTMSHIASYIPV